jgi:G6PDH family F420-dependent oxidoreductase
MVTIGYMSDLMTDAPGRSMEYAVLAEQLGFRMVGAADHFYPWIHTDQNCAFAWVWLTAVAARTRTAAVGTMVTAPILRYNPAIIAQAFATMEQMFPSRVFLGLGAGEAINEIPAGYPWPSAGERVKRLEEALIIIRSLWTEEQTSFDGEFFSLKKTRLYPRPTRHIPLLLAAGKPRTIELAGKYADGLVTVPQLSGSDTVLNFEAAARRAGRDPSKLQRHLNFGISFDRDYDKALAACKPWAATILPFIFEYGISDPREVERYSHLIDERELAKAWLITDDPEECLRAVERYAKLGFSHLHVQSLSPNEEGFVKMMGEKVIPHFTTSVAPQ